MKNIALRFARNFFILAVIYPFGVLIAALLAILCVMRFVRIKRWNKFPKLLSGTIVVANHPSMMDPFLVAAMCFKGYLYNPFKYGPVVVADQNNFYDSWWFFLLRPFMISVKREDTISEKRLEEMKKVIERGGTLVVFPEGGRTSSGKDILTTPKGKKMRRLKPGIGYLILSTGASVFTLGIDGTERFFANNRKGELYFFQRFGFGKIVVKVGDFIFWQGKDLDRKKITSIVEKALLDLVDRED